MSVLTGMRIVECAAFIAGPFATMKLAQLGAEVIRIDPREGGIDQHRWPVTAQGASLYWAGLNKGKKSVAIDIRHPEGRELAQAIITAPGEDAGLFVTNFPATGWLDFDGLRRRRADLIMVNIVGNRDGSTALDYTVNCAVGFPDATGHVDGTEPTNHVLPAWDLICGQSAAMALLAAERHRSRTGTGQQVRIALSDIALAVVGDMGFLAEVQINGHGRPRYGNHIYGAFGRDFMTADSRRLMIAAVSGGQWQALCKAVGLQEAIAGLERSRNANFAREADRFAARDHIAAIFEPWFAARTLDQAREVLDAGRVCWGPYQSFEQLIEDPRCSPSAGLFAEIDHPGIGRTLTPGSPISFSDCDPVPPGAGPLPGGDTDEVLMDVLGLASGAVGALRDRGVVGPATAG